MEVQASKDRRALEEATSRAKADREVFLRQIDNLQAQLALVDSNSVEKLRKSLQEMQKEMMSNEEKLAAYDSMKKVRRERGERASEAMGAKKGWSCDATSFFCERAGEAGGEAGDRANNLLERSRASEASAKKGWSCQKRAGAATQPPSLAKRAGEAGDAPTTFSSARFARPPP
jgi:hypothetical protein